MAEKVQIFNNLTRSKLPFVPVKAGEVKFYSCGPTVYDFIHVGNARALIVGDLIHRIFKTLGYQVTFVRNFTDVDDKIINKAKEKNEDALIYAKRFINECNIDMNELGMLPATHTPLVSETITDIIKLIEDIIKNGFGYVVDGEVFFHVPAFRSYGKLSKKKLEQLEHGNRVEVDDKKKHPSDFVLWKPAKEGEIFWQSPWGKGRPGWHIECSAMSKKYLGETFDIHHGGVDLMFPHHENEIAQSEAGNGKPYCNYWCHHEFLNFGDTKMSKSLGNVVTIRQFTDKFGGVVLRQLLLSAHYRTVMVWSEQAIERAISDVERIHKFVIHFKIAKAKNVDPSGSDELTGKIEDLLNKMKKDLSNDFNVPGAIAHFFSMIRMINRDYLDEQLDFSNKKKLTPDLIQAIDALTLLTKNAVGMIYDNPEEVLNTLERAKKNISKQEQKLSNEAIEKLIIERKEARISKNWSRADEIRKELDASGIVLKDSPDGTVTWSYK